MVMQRLAKPSPLQNGAWVRIPHPPPIFKIGAGKNQNPTPDTLKKIAKALEVSIDEITKRFLLKVSGKVKL